MSKASNLLKRSDHFWSNADVLSSEAEEEADFLDLVGGFYFLTSFSGGNGGD